ncbi:hypothetical protein CEXT_768411 [Caerostris extrusa]|uniref:PWWP domain-containing protein n=1 Tax=Caerostris extrusa TaxID=172846 RepID=A0AAV4YAY0_CAEEX|nr:hypothetical protein CEXT_768411 [Caerostris extrusa]
MWSMGDIVWAKINDDWWPGVISNPENYKYVMVGENKIFVERFGDLQGLEGGHKIIFAAWRTLKPKTLE